MDNRALHLRHDGASRLECRRRHREHRRDAPRNERSLRVGQIEYCLLSERSRRGTRRRESEYPRDSNRRELQLQRDLESRHLRRLRRRSSLRAWICRRHSGECHLPSTLSVERIIHATRLSFGRSHDRRDCVHCLQRNRIDSCVGGSDRAQHALGRHVRVHGRRCEYASIVARLSHDDHERLSRDLD